LMLGRVGAGEAGWADAEGDAMVNRESALNDARRERHACISVPFSASAQASLRTHLLLTLE